MRPRRTNGNRDCSDAVLGICDTGRHATRGLVVLGSPFVPGETIGVNRRSGGRGWSAAKPASQKGKNHN